MTRVKGIIIILMVCCFLVSATLSFAQEIYPNRTIQLIVPMAPGGSMDLLSRVVADKFRDYFGQPVVVLNKAGANQALGTAFVATAKPDGYNICVAGAASVELLKITTPNVYGLTDMAAVGGFAKYPQVIFVNKSVPVKTVPELVSYIKKNPRLLSYGITGVGSTAHLIFESLKLASNIPTGDIPAIPYTGAAPVLTALLGNQVQVSIMAWSALLAKQAESGAIRILSVNASEPSSLVPGVPTIVEQGFPQLATSAYLTFWVPPKTPAPVIKKLEDATRKITEDRDVREKIISMYHEPAFVNSQEVRKYVENEVAKWSPMIKKLNITMKP